MDALKILEIMLYVLPFALAYGVISAVAMRSWMRRA